jgi:hypothetical protein
MGLGLLVWIAGCVGVGYLAGERGRSEVLWGLLSAVVSPVVGLIVLLVLDDM